MSASKPVNKGKGDGSHPALGSQIGEYRVRRVLRTSYLVLVVGGFTVAVVAGMLALWRWYFAYRHYGPAVVVRWSGSALNISLGAATVGLLALLASLRLGSFCIRTYEEGFSIERRRHKEIILWREIRQLQTTDVQYAFFGWTWWSRSSLKIFMDNDSTLRLTQSLDDVYNLTETIKRYVYPDLLDKYVQLFNKGESIPFGRLVLTQQGVQYGQSTIPWSEVGQASLNRGFLNIQDLTAERERIIQIKTHRVPNVDLCIQLIQNILANQNGKHSLRPR